MSYFLRNFPSSSECTSTTTRAIQLFQGIRAKYMEFLLEASRMRYGRQEMLLLLSSRSGLPNGNGGGGGRQQGIGREEEQKNKRANRGRHLNCGGGKRQCNDNAMNKNEFGGATEQNGSCEQHDRDDVYRRMVEMLDTLEMAAIPSAFGANALAQAIVNRFDGDDINPLNSNAKMMHDVAGQFPEKWLSATTTNQCRNDKDDNDNGGGMQTTTNLSAMWMRANFQQKLEKQQQKRDDKSNLVSMSLDSVFSVLLALNRRDPELCATSLHCLLQMLQEMEPESLRGQSRAVTTKMHGFLRELRRDGNANVSAAANACMMSLSVASGQPDLIFATIAALLCETKRHLPHNRISTDSNPLPRNLQILAQSAQHLILGQQQQQPSSSSSAAADAKQQQQQHCSWLSIPLERHPMVCEFDVIYTGSALSNTANNHFVVGIEKELCPADTITTNECVGCPGCLVSDGAYIYLLNGFGLLKMGTGLSETRAGEVLTCNELLKFSEGTSLFVSNDTLYLRRRHSSRLWVLDKDNLREIGEIILPSTLTSHGLLFADGRQFWHAQLDDRWHLVCTVLDDSFLPQDKLLSPPGNNTAETTQQQKQQQTTTMAMAHTMPFAGNATVIQSRLVNVEFVGFGDLNDHQRRLLSSIPCKLREIAADLQLSTNIAFLLTRCGKVFYANNNSIECEFHLPAQNCPPFTWSRLQLSEPIVAMALDATNSTLVLRSGSGNLWVVGGSIGPNMHGKLPRKGRQQQNADEKEESAANGGEMPIWKLKIPNKRKCISMSVVSVAGGCLAYVTDKGRCFLLGRHILNNSSSAGGGTGTLFTAEKIPYAGKQIPAQIAGLEQIPVVQVSLGKTHLALISKSGAVYAIGLNNQNQCGREQQPNLLSNVVSNTSPPPPTSSITSNTSSTSFSSQQQQQNPFCASAQQHMFLDDQAALCILCGQCSVRGTCCPYISAQAKGTFCPCLSAGPSCCLRCGLCKACATAKDRKAAAKTTNKNDNKFVANTGNISEHFVDTNNTKLLHNVGSSSGSKITMTSPKMVRMQQMMETNIAASSTTSSYAPLAKDEFTEQLPTKEKSAIGEIATIKLPKQKLEKEKSGSGTSTTATRIFGPERVLLQQQPTIKVASISVGNFHTVVLSADNQVYTFGANTYGQLGTGDTIARHGANRPHLPANIQVVQAVAGANHTVLRTLDGRLITFGAHKAGQLGRKRLATPAVNETKTTSTTAQSPTLRQWFAEPAFVPKFDRACGQLASWVGAEGDRTLVQVQRQLLSRTELANGWISANADSMLMLPGGHGGTSQPIRCSLNSHGPLMTIPTTTSNKSSSADGYIFLKRMPDDGGARGRGGRHNGLLAGKKNRFAHFQWETQKTTRKKEQQPSSTNGGVPTIDEFQLRLDKCSFCLDPKHFTLLWAYDPRRMCVFALTNNINGRVSAGIPQFLQQHRHLILRSTELMVPSSIEEAVFGGPLQQNDLGTPDSNGGDSVGNNSSGLVRYSDCQLAIFLLFTVYSLWLATVAGQTGNDMPEKHDERHSVESIDDGELLVESELLLDDLNASGFYGGNHCALSTRAHRVINRFEHFGGGWGYSAHCVEAIQFKTNKDIYLCGVGLFGGRGEYTARVKLFRLLDNKHAEQQQHEQQRQQQQQHPNYRAANPPQQSVEMLAETDEVLYECGQRETAVLQLEQPIQVQQQCWHVIWVQIQGPSSDCGAGGAAVVKAGTTDDDAGDVDDDDDEHDVQFHFAPSALSNNGTNVEVGQIPEIYFLLPSDFRGGHSNEEAAYANFGCRGLSSALIRSGNPNGMNTEEEQHQHWQQRHRPLQLISAASLFSVGPGSINSLLQVAEWALDGAFLPLDHPDELLDCDYTWRQERAALVAILCLRLIRLFLCTFLPVVVDDYQQSKMPPQQQQQIGSHEIVEFHQLLKHILERRIQENDQVGILLLTETVTSYVLCAHLFAPIADLLRNRMLQQLCYQPAMASEGACWWLLAVLESLECQQHLLLTVMGFELNTDEDENNSSKRVKCRKNRMQQTQQMMAQALWKTETVNDQQQHHNGRKHLRENCQAILHFLLELAFAEIPDDEVGDSNGKSLGHGTRMTMAGSSNNSRASDQDEHNKVANSKRILLLRLKAISTRLVAIFARQLVSQYFIPRSGGFSTGAQQQQQQTCKRLMNQHHQQQSPPLQTPSRFRHISAHFQWDVGNGADAWDAVGIRLEPFITTKREKMPKNNRMVLLHGVGIFSGMGPAAASQQPVAESAEKRLIELELLQNTTNADEQWQLVARVCTPLDTFPTQSVLLPRPCALHPAVTYALRVRFNNPGKTFFGEAGLSAINLQDHCRLHFLPCVMSRNGTNVARGQFPFLLYSFVDKGNKTQKLPKNAENQQHPNRRLESEDDVSAQQQFLQLLRWLVQRLGQRMVNNNIAKQRLLLLHSTEQFLFASVLGQVNLLAEYRPQMAFDMITVLDEAIPILAHVNNSTRENITGICQHEDAEEEEDSDDDDDHDETTPSLIIQTEQDMAQKSNQQQTAQSQPKMWCLESAHPYRAGQLLVYQVAIPNAQFLCLRFDPQCRTATADDSLWVYAVKCDEEKIVPDREGDGCLLFPVARYSGSNNWPRRNNTLTVPGNKLWLLFETAHRDADLSVESCFGFRCSVESISAEAFVAGTSSNQSLECQFVWCLANACKQLLIQRIDDDDDAGDEQCSNGTHAQDNSNSMEKCDDGNDGALLIRDMLNRHATLARRGICFGAAVNASTENASPSLGELIHGNGWNNKNKAEITAERQFLNEFATTDNNNNNPAVSHQKDNHPTAGVPSSPSKSTVAATSAASLLAQMLCSQEPFVHLGNSQLHISLPLPPPSSTSSSIIGANNNKQQHQFHVGKSYEFRFICRDQHNRDVHLFENDGMEVDVVLMSNCHEEEDKGGDGAACNNRNLTEASSNSSITTNTTILRSSAIDLAALKHKQLKLAPFHPVSVGRALFQCCTMLSDLVGYSFEELRFAFLFGEPSNERIRLRRNNDDDREVATSFSGKWTPRCAGTFFVHVRVDGRQASLFPPPLPASFSSKNVVLTEQQQQQIAVSSSSYTNASTFLNLQQGIIRVVSSQHDDGDSAAPFQKRVAHRCSEISRPSRRAHFPPVSPYHGVRVRAHPSLSAAQIGFVARGSWLEFTEIQRNSDGLWLKLAECTRNELLHRTADGAAAGIHGIDHHHYYCDDRGVHQSPTKLASGQEAWVLQFNSHLQNEYFQMPSPIDTANFDATMPPQPSVTTFEPLQNPQQQNPSELTKSRHSSQPQTTPSTFSPSGNRLFALGPSLLEAFRWAFCACAWHTSTSSSTLASSFTSEAIANCCCCTVEELMDAAKWLRRRHELAERGKNNVASAYCETHLHSSSWPISMQKAMWSWQMFYRELCQRIGGGASKQHNQRANDVEIQPTQDNNDQHQQPKQQNAVIVAHCELCDGHQQFASPIGVHMREMHPGCGGPSMSYGYNSAGQWTTGWSGKCGDGGQGDAVWYLLCAQCRQRYLHHKLNTKESDRHRHHQLNRKTTNFCAERMKRNAQFLLELNRNECVAMARRGINDGAAEKAKDVRRGAPVVLAVDPYPQAGPRTLLMMRSRRGGTTEPKKANNGNGRKTTCWHCSDPGSGTIPDDQRANNNFFNTIQTRPCSNSANADFVAGLAQNPHSTMISNNNNHQARNADDVELLNSVLAFVADEREHDLSALRTMYRHQLFRAVSFTFAFRLWTWLAKMTTINANVHDTIWHFISTLWHFAPNCSSNNSNKHNNQQQASLLPHPSQLCLLGGRQPLLQMVQQFHAFLQQLVIFLQPRSDKPIGNAGELGMDMRLRCLCFRAWTFQLTGYEQTLLPIIRILLSIVGNELSCSTSDTTDSAPLAAHKYSTMSTAQTIENVSLLGQNDGTAAAAPEIRQLDDVTDQLHLSTSSRAQLLGCLLDHNCDTFWESGEEERGQGTERKLFLRWNAADGNNANDDGDGGILLQPILIALYLDNARDNGFRIQRIMAKYVVAVVNGDDNNDAAKSQTHILMDQQLDKNFSGWLKFLVTDILNRVEISLWGDELGCRVRQLRAIGHRAPQQPQQQLLHRVPIGAMSPLPSSALESATQKPPPTAAAATAISTSSCSMRPSNSQQQFLLFGGGTYGEPFTLFHALATQVFGDEFGAGEGNGKLRQQVLDLLFSRSQLQPLQSFIGAYVSDAIEREITMLSARRNSKRNFAYINALLQVLVRMCSTTASGSPSTVDLAAMTNFMPDSNLLVVLSRLALFASDSVQVQALKAMQKLLARTIPTTSDSSGSSDGGESTTMVSAFVENLLVLIGKAITLQIKQRRAETMGTAPFLPSSSQQQQLQKKQQLTTHCIGILPHWYPERTATCLECASLCICLFRTLPSQWRSRVRAEVGTHIMRLCQLLRDLLTAQGHITPENIRCHQFWLAIAALGCMDAVDWLQCAPDYQQLKVDQTHVQDPLCENHDDGHTRAQLRCQTCAICLCRECFAVLHLNRRAQSHHAQLVGTALVPLPRVDFHEGCHRLRIGTTLMLLNPDTLTGLVELGGGGGSSNSNNYAHGCCAADGDERQTINKMPVQLRDNNNAAVDVTMPQEGITQMDEGEEWHLKDQNDGEERFAAAAGEHSIALEEDEQHTCRFCNCPLASEQLFAGVCAFEECRRKQLNACSKTLCCGHWCSGIAGEQICSPCLRCLNSSNRHHQDADDLCAICYSERLGESPCLLLRCRHTFHYHCLRTCLEKCWPGPRISFRFMHCPLCKAQIAHPALDALLHPLRELMRDVAQKARMRMDYEGIGHGNDDAKPMTSAEMPSADEGEFLESALAKYMYVQCSRCSKAYFGGDARCQQELEQAGLAQQVFDPAELICGSCAVKVAGGVGQQAAGVCGRHGTDFLEFKCRFCCSIAMYFCFGSTHFCAACHGDFQRLMALPKHALPKCPAGPRAQQLPENEACPLRIEAHPPTGEEFALGCGICRNLHTF